MGGVPPQSLSSEPPKTIQSEQLADEGVPGRKLIFFIASAAVVMAGIDQTIVATALPVISFQLHTFLNVSTWTVTIYAVGQLIALPIAGRLSDQFGRKKLFLVCIGIFTVSSLLCGLSTSIYMLIPLRFIQALGGGGLMPSATRLVADHFGKDRDRAIGMFSTITPIGTISGPILGGVITQYWTWRGVFFINLPIGIVLFLLIRHYIPESSRRDTARFDFGGVLLLALTVIAGMVAITMYGEPGMSVSDLRVVLPAVAAVLLGWRFLHHVRLAASPFIAYRFLRGKGFATMNFVNFLYGGSVNGFVVLVTLYAQIRYAIPVAESGIVQSARNVGMLAMAGVATALLRRTGYRLPMAVGFTISAIGLAMLSVGARVLIPSEWIALFGLVVGLGLGTAAPATNNATLQLAPDNVAELTGIRAMFRLMGGIVYLSIATTMIAKSSLTDSLGNPLGNPGNLISHVFLIQAALLMVMSAVVYTIPDHRGSW
jgi:EmrB/QacA subfamily drug resistance transporter